MSGDSKKKGESKLKLSKTTTKDLTVKAGKAGAVKGGKTACGGISCIPKLSG